MGTYVGPKRADVFIRSASGYIYELSVEHSYRMYVTKQLVSSAQGKYLGVDWGEIVSDEERRPVKQENGEAIAMSVIKRAGLVVKNS